jgi:DNA-binding SARP family transcriptional activator/predicted ATPase
MRINLFGHLRVSREGQPVAFANTSRVESLLAYLILHGETPQPRERLAFVLWPGSTESQARTNLRQLLHHLKRALPADCKSLITDHQFVQWRRTSCEIDAVDFQAAIADAASARIETDRSREIRSLTAAAQLCEDDLLPGLYDDWLTPIREEYRQRVCEVLRRLATLYEEQMDFAAAIPFAERLVALDPIGEAHHQLLMQLHAANHDRASALRAYHQCMRVLRREMGVEPGPATVQLFERILKAEPEAPREKTSALPAKGVLAPQGTRVLIGRAREWRQLMAAWEAAAEIGPRVVLISGEPGIGKTRLADEFFQSCVSQGHAAARSRCYAGQGQVAYAPVAEWLRSDVVREGWPSLTPGQAAELARLAPEIRDHLPKIESPASGEALSLAESLQRLRFYESINAAVGKSRKPLLLYLDDMQWCDPASFEWLSSLLNAPAATGVLLLGTVRAEETGREHPFARFVAGLRQAGIAEEIPLEPLGAEETAELARRESVQPLDNGKLSEIVNATRGNPLFVIESVRGGLQSTRVQSVIAARLAQLSTASYELAGIASVIGLPFTVDLLEKATDWDELSVSEALDELWRRRIVESRGAAEYDFTHDRLREVAFSELTPVRRRYFHRRVARALAEVYGTDIEIWSGQIASHFEQAGMAEEAIEYFRRAAGYARQRYAHTEATRLLQQALALCRGFPQSDGRLKQELDLLVTLGPALVAVVGYSAADVGETYHRALEISQRFDDRRMYAIYSGAWAYHAVRGDLTVGLQFSMDFLRLAEREGTAGLLRAGNFLMGSSLFHLGRLEESLRHMRAAKGRHDRSEESVLALFAGPDLGVFCDSYLAHLNWLREEEDADPYAAEAIATANQIRDPFSQAIALAYATLLHVFRGESAAALERGREAVEVCARHGVTYYQAMGNIVTGWARAAEGESEHGLSQLQEGLDAFRTLGAEIRLPYYMSLLAETLLRAGRAGEALAAISTGFAFAGKNGEEWAAAELNRMQGELLLCEGKTGAARDSFRRGIEAARKSGALAFERKLSGLLGGTVAFAS